MTNTREKGRRHEKACEDMLIKEGWSTYRVKGSTPFQKSQDLFGLFDVMAIRPKQDKSSEILFIQVKTNRRPDIRPFLEFKKIHPSFRIEIWVWFDRKGFTKEIV